MFSALSGSGVPAVIICLPPSCRLQRTPAVDGFFLNPDPLCRGPLLSRIIEPFSPTLSPQGTNSFTSAPFPQNEVSDGAAFDKLLHGQTKVHNKCGDLGDNGILSLTVDAPLRTSLQLGPVEKRYAPNCLDVYRAL